jgi:hypothetical protein
MIAPLSHDAVRLVADRTNLRRVSYDVIREIAAALVDEGFMVPIGDACALARLPAGTMPRDADRVAIDDGRASYVTSVIRAYPNEVAPYVVVLGGDTYRLAHVTVTDRAFYESEIRAGVDRLAYALSRASGSHGWGPPYDDAGADFRVDEDHKRACRQRVLAIVDALPAATAVHHAAAPSVHDVVTDHA